MASGGKNSCDRVAASLLKLMKNDAKVYYVVYINYDVITYRTYVMPAHSCSIA